MKDKIETIRQACIKANPEIVKLEFGCVIASKPQCKLPPINAPIVLQFSRDCWVVSDSNYGVVGNYHKDEVEIIGRPIRLADILIVMGNTGGIFVGVDENGQIDVSPFKGDCQWNLLKDDLTLQSEETIDFIFNLLNK